MNYRHYGVWCVIRRTRTAGVILSAPTITREARLNPGDDVWLALIGTQFFKAEDAEPRAKRLFRLAIERLQPKMVISGGAEGADKWAEEVARDMGYKTQWGNLLIYKPWKKGWQYYKARNEQIAVKCTHLLAVRCAFAKTYGIGVDGR